MYVSDLNSVLCENSLKLSYSALKSNEFINSGPETIVKEKGTATSQEQYERKQCRKYSNRDHKDTCQYVQNTDEYYLKNVKASIHHINTIITSCNFFHKYVLKVHTVTQ